MKKRIEIRQDWKRGFGSAPTGIKNWVKWSLGGFVVYVAVRFVCAFLGGVAIGLGGMLPMLAVFGGGGLPHPCLVVHPFRFPFPLRARSSHPCSLRDTTEY